MATTTNRVRSQTTVHLIREQVDRRTGKVRLIEAHMPCGPGWMNGNQGALDWINLGVGWQSYDAYMANKNSGQAAVKREKAVAEKAESPSAPASEITSKPFHKDKK